MVLLMHKPYGGANPPALGLQLLTGEEYLEKLTHDVAAAQSGDRILVMTMAVDPAEPAVATLLHELYRAARRGASVMIGADAYTYSSHRRYGDLVVPWATNRQAHLQSQAEFSRLTSLETVTFKYLNMPSLPFAFRLAGRCHIKVSLVGDRVYLGGVNLQNAGRLDMMVFAENQSLANLLYHLCGGIIDAGSVRQALGPNDLRITLDAETELLVDVGRPGRSAILDEAYSIIEQAAEWLAISFQYLPYGRIADLVEEAVARRVELFIYTNRPDLHSSKAILGAQRLIVARRGRARLPELRSGEVPAELPGMHAKGVANEKTGLATGHNLVSAGVFLGTAEIAIVRRTPQFGLAIREHFARLVAEASQHVLAA
jgi:hypothetical protein